MKVSAIIPSRYQSTRLPGKPLKEINGKTLIQRVYEAVKETNLFEHVIVATDHQGIYDHVKSFNGEVKMTSEDHKSGSDRIAEVAKKIDSDIIINVQGDEPFISKKPLAKLINAFEDKSIDVATLMHILEEDENNPNFVKVVFDNDYDALYFSRSAIPYDRDGHHDITYYKHIGVYAYKRDVLLDYVNLPHSKLEDIEKLEQLRLLENGYKIKVIPTEYEGIGIDTPEDLERAIDKLN